MGINVTKQYTVIEIQEQATILKSDGTKEFDEAVYIGDNNIHFGKIEIKRKNDLLNIIIHSTTTVNNSFFNGYEEFIENSRIPKKDVLETVNGFKRYVLKQIP